MSTFRRRLLRVAVAIMVIVHAVMGVILIGFPSVFAGMHSVNAVSGWTKWVLALLGARALAFAFGMLLALRDPDRHRSWLIATVLSSMSTVGKAWRRRCGPTFEDVCVLAERRLSHLPRWGANIYLGVEPRSAGGPHPSCCGNYSSAAGPRGRYRSVPGDRVTLDRGPHSRQRQPARTAAEPVRHQRALGQR
jgi:hypothetical protein